jgi:site-specific DNA-methyltransferase (adenine-specific)
MAMAKALTSSAYRHWCTPRWLWKLVAEFFGGSISLDPCSNRWTSVRARTRWTEGGLDRYWADGTYVNPPYGYVIKKWTTKCAVESRGGGRVIGLVPARVDTTWWHGSVPGEARAVCFLKGRVKFERPRRHGRSWTAGFPSAIVLWSHTRNRAWEIARFRKTFGHLGWIVEV